MQNFSDVLLGIQSFQFVRRHAMKDLNLILIRNAICVATAHGIFNAYRGREKYKMSGILESMA